MPTITNTDTVSHWSDAAEQQIPGRCSITVTAAVAAAQSNAGPLSTSATALEIVETAREDGTPTRITRSHR